MRIAIGMLRIAEQPKRQRHRTTHNPKSVMRASIISAIPMASGSAQKKMVVPLALEETWVEIQLPKVMQQPPEARSKQTKALRTALKSEEQQVRLISPSVFTFELLETSFALKF